MSLRLPVGDRRGYPVVDADIPDARTNAVPTTYEGASAIHLAGQGIGGVDDLFDRAADLDASGFEKWLSAP